MPFNIQYISLFKELERRSALGDPFATDLKSRILLSINQIDTILSEIRVYFRHFTEHCLNHSLRIIHNIESFLERSQYELDKNGKALTSVDIFLLIASSLVHDIGMVIRESELDDLILNPVFCEHIERWKSLDHGSTYDWCRHGIPRLAVAEFVRQHHPKRTMQMILCEDLIPRSLTEGSPKLAFWLARICAGHGMPLEDICNTSEFPPSVDIQLPGGMVEKCNPRFLTLCLRLGDLLDIGTARACPLLRHLSEPLSSLSEMHWDQYKDIEIRGLEPHSEITIAGTCPTQQAERVLREWVSWLEKEASLAISVQNQDKPHYYLHMGRIRFMVQPEEINGHPAYEFLEFRFNLDEKMVFERLFGKSLYGRQELAFREIIQNAVDAQRALILKNLSSESEWNSMSEKECKVAFRRRMVKVRNSMPIVISLETEDNALGSFYTWLTITDNGIGMTRETIEKYLLKVGRSRWGDDPEVARYGIGNVTIGTFGIGFLSSLMIADRITIETRSCLPNQEGIKATIYGWQSYLATEPFPRGSNGTSISLRLNHDYFESPFELGSILSELVPLPDFPLIVDLGAEQILVPMIDLGKHSTRDQEVQTTLHLDEDGSIVSVINYTRNRHWSGNRQITEDLYKRKRNISLCQDGIAISEIPAPQDDDPESKMLNRMQLLLDLRSDLRMPLDLSRNLVECGQQQFWQKFVPICVDKLCEAYVSDNIAFEAIFSLVNEEARADRGDFLRFTHPKGSLLRGIESIKDLKSITCIEASNRLTREHFVAEDMVACLLPTPSEIDFALDGVRWEELGNDNNVHTKNENRFYGMPPEDPDDFLWSESVQKLSTPLDKEWRFLTDQFKWVGPGKSTRCRLHREPLPGTKKIAEILGFNVTPGWVCLAEPWQGLITITPTIIFEDLPNVAYNYGLDLADYYIFLIHSLFSWPESYGSRYPFDMQEQFLQLRDILYNRTREMFLLKEEREDETFDNDESEQLSEDDIGGLIPLEPPDVIGSLTHNLQRNHSIFTGIAKEAGLQLAIGSWELSQWEKGIYKH